MVNTAQTAAVKLYEKIWFVSVWELKNELFYNEKYFDEYVMEYYI